MTLLHDAIEAKKVDVRILSRNVERGAISPIEAQKIVNELPDDGENADYVSIENLAGGGERNSALAAASSTPATASGSTEPGGTPPSSAST